MLLLALGASLFSGLFVLSYAYVLHAPHPHAMRVEAVADARGVAQIREALQKRAPGGFDVRAAPDVRGARAAIEGGSSYGALVLPQRGPATILTAGAAGAQAQKAVTTAFTAVAGAEGRTVRTADLVPLGPNDRVGQSSFALQLGLLIPGVLGSVGFYLLGRRARIWARVAAALCYAIVSAAIGVLVVDGVLGALTGSPGTLLLTAMLTSATAVLVIAALHALFGMPGTAIAAVVLLVVGGPLNGSTVPVPLLPDGYRQIAPWLPNAAATRLFREAVYFRGHGAAQPLLALILWSLGALLIIGTADLIHLHQRRTTTRPHAGIYAKPIMSRLQHGKRGLRSSTVISSPTL